MQRTCSYLYTNCIKFCEDAGNIATVQYLPCYVFQPIKIASQRAEMSALAKWDRIHLFMGFVQKTDIFGLLLSNDILMIYIML